MAEKQILLVDDDEDLCFALGIRLRKNGYRVMKAGDGVEALQLTHRKHPDLIILDIGIPAGNGFYVLEILKAKVETALIPVLILSARDPRETRDKAVELGADAYLQKPADNAELLSTITEFLDDGTTETGND